MAKETVLYLTHRADPWVVNNFNTLKKQAGQREAIFLYNGQENNNLPSPHICYTNAQLNELQYSRIGDTIVPGHAHFPVFKYFTNQKEPSDYYWVIEYDVRFTGSWSYLFDHFLGSDSHFISSLIRTYEEHLNFEWWGLHHPTKNIPQQKWVASFNPMYRISKPALEFLDHCFNNNWKGHFEVSIPTLLHENGFELEDFGGSGQFVKGKRNKFYTNVDIFDHMYYFGTFRYRPVRDKPGFKKNKIYHPVKADSEAGLQRNWDYFKYRLHKRYGVNNVEMVKNILLQQPKPY